MKEIGWVLIHHNGERDTFAVGIYRTEEDAQTVLRGRREAGLLCEHTHRAVPMLIDVAWMMVDQMTDDQLARAAVDLGVALPIDLDELRN